MIVETVRLWKDDDSLEYEARSTFFMEKLINVEEYPYINNFKNHPNKCFITVRNLGSYIVAENYEDLRDRLIKFHEQGTTPRRGIDDKFWKKLGYGDSLQ